MNNLDRIRARDSVSRETRMSDFLKIPVTQVILQSIDNNGVVINEQDLGHNYVLYGMGKILAGFFAMSMYAGDPGLINPSFSDIYNYIDYATALNHFVGATCMSVGEGNSGWPALVSFNEEDPLARPSVISMCDSTCSSYASDYPTPTPPSPGPYTCHNYCRKKMEGEKSRKPFDTSGVKFLKWDVDLEYTPLVIGDMYYRPIVQFETTFTKDDFALSGSDILLHELAIWGGFDWDHPDVPIFNADSPFDATYFGRGVMMNWKIFSAWYISADISLKIIYRFFF